MIVHATENQLEDVAALALKLFPETGSDTIREEMRALLSDGNAAIFLHYTGEGVPVGFAQCQLRFDYVEGKMCIRDSYPAADTRPRPFCVCPKAHAVGGPFGKKAKRQTRRQAKKTEKGGMFLGNGKEARQKESEPNACGAHPKGQ